HAPHEFRLVTGEIVIHSHDVDTTAGERVEVSGQGRDQRLSLTGLHLCDVSEVKSTSTHDLHIEVPQTERAPGRLAHSGEGLWHQGIEGLTVRESAAEVVGECTQLIIGQAFVCALHGIGQGDDLAKTAQHTTFAHADNAIEN